VAYLGLFLIFSFFSAFDAAFFSFLRYVVVKRMKDAI